MTLSYFDKVVGQYQQSIVMLLKGKPETIKRMWSYRQEITLLNPFGSLLRGWIQVSETLNLVASSIREGVIVFEILSRYERRAEPGL
jgi:hypothetical protein